MNKNRDSPETIKKMLAKRSRERAQQLQGARQTIPAENLILAKETLRSAREKLDGVMDLVRKRNELIRRARGKE